VNHRQHRSEDLLARDPHRIVHTIEDRRPHEITFVETVARRTRSTANKRRTVSTTDVDDARARVERKLRLRPEVVTCSALRGRNVAKLLPKALQQAALRIIKSPELPARFEDEASRNKHRKMLDALGAKLAAA